MIDTAAKVIDTLKESKKPILCMDSRADFDALCSSIILRRYLTHTLGKELCVTFDGVLPDAIRDLTAQYADISFLKENVCPATDIDFSQYDLHIFLDSGNIEHICKDNKYILNPNIKKLNIDHHAGNPLYGDVNYVKPFASCCTVLFNLFREANIEIEQSLVNVYYLGVLLDSGFFQYNTVTSEDFLMASELIKMGAECYEITWKLTFNEKLQDMKLKGLVYSNLIAEEKLKVAYSTITIEELCQRGIVFDQTVYPPSDMIKRLEGVDFIFVVRENENERTNFSVSFRSHEANFDVLSIAKHFGGGGHVMAAGADIKAGSIAEAVETILTYLNKP